MTDERINPIDIPEPTARSTAPDGPAEGMLPRREFLRVAGAGAGLFMVGGTEIPRRLEAATPKPITMPVATSASADIVVIGAGGWGAFTALNLIQKGHKVTLVDAYGPGNARSTSGDETRGVRSSYGDRPGEQGETWTLWAREAMGMWKAFDDEWGKHFRLNLFHVTGDLIMRTEWDNFQLRTKGWWDKHKIPYEVLNASDVKKSFPVLSIDDITAVLYEPDAGVVRARRSAQAAASAFETLGGKIVIGRATPGKMSGGKLDEIILDTGQTLRADTFVWCVGPWMGKTFPDILAKKTRVPIGYVVYFATPVNDQRFTFPNLPSYNCRASPAGPRCRLILAGSGCAAPSARQVRRRARRERFRSVERRRRPLRAELRVVADAAQAVGAAALLAPPAVRPRPVVVVEAVVEAVVVAVVVAEAVVSRRTFRSRSRIRIRAIAGPTRIASTAHAASSSTAFPP